MVMRNEDRPKRDDQALAVNAGPSTPIKDYGGGLGYRQNYGAGRLKNVKPKPGFTLKDVYGN